MTKIEEMIRRNMECIDEYVYEYVDSDAAWDPEGTEDKAFLQGLKQLAQERRKLFDQRDAE